MFIIPRNIDEFLEWGSGKNYKELIEVVDAIVILSDGQKFFVTENKNRPGFLDVRATESVHIHPEASNHILMTEGWDRLEENHP